MENIYPMLIAFFMIFNSKSKNKLEKTSLRLKWVCQAQFAGYYSALKTSNHKNHEGNLNAYY